MENLSLRFIRWSVGLLMLGLLTGYGPLGHYLLGGVEHACPWAPVHGHIGILGWIGMTIFGLVYQAIPKWANGKSPSLRLVKSAFCHLRDRSAWNYGEWNFWLPAARSNFSILLLHSKQAIPESLVIN